MLQVPRNKAVTSDSKVFQLMAEAFDCTWRAEVHEAADGQTLLLCQAAAAKVHLQAQSEAAKTLLCRLAACRVPLRSGVGLNTTFLNMPMVDDTCMNRARKYC